VGHLVIEKLIKGLYAKKNPDNPHAVKKHDLLLLANNCNLELDDDKKIQLDLVTTFNINARYEDYKKEFYNKCTKEYTDEKLIIIEELRTWLKTHLI